MIVSFKNRHHSIYIDSPIEFLEMADGKLPESMSERNLPVFEKYKNLTAADLPKKQWLPPTAPSTRAVIEKSVTGDHELYEKTLLPMIEKFNMRIEGDSIQTAPVAKRRRVRKNFGDELDIHMVNQGKLDRAWSTTERVEEDQQHHLITLLINISGSHTVPFYKSLWTTAAAIKTIEDLQAAGKNVKVIVGGFSVQSTKNGSGIDWSCCVKRYNERLSIEQLTAMSHIGFLRSVGFLAMTTCSEQLAKNLGYPKQFDKNRLPDNLKQEIAEGHTKVIIINMATSESEAIRELNSVKQQFSINS